MKRHFAFLVAVLLSTPMSPATTRASVVRTGEPDGDAAATSWMERYVGDPVDLRYGYGDPAEVLREARGMASVAAATGQLLARGYVRRPDTDAAFTGTGYSCALLGFEKPGYALADRQPVLFVITRAVEVPDAGWRPATQVFCSVLRDSAGLPVPAVAPDDSSLFVFGTMQPDGAAGGGADEDALVGGDAIEMNPDLPPFTSYRHSAGEFDYVVPPTVSAGMQTLITAGWYETLRGGVVGAVVASPSLLTGGETGVLRVAVGFVAGAYAAHRAYWYSKPDTTQVRR